jgi:hypothetical protein
VRSRSALVVAVFGALATLFLAAPAGAASGLGQVTVSNQSPAPASELEVSSSGWKPGGVVSIVMTGTEGVLARARADATGAARLRFSVPADAAIGSDVLSVVGSTTGGIPQQITTVLEVPAPAHRPAPSRPWTAVFVLLALAAIVMLVGERADRRPTVVVAA